MPVRVTLLVLETRFWEFQTAYSGENKEEYKKTYLRTEYREIGHFGLQRNSTKNKLEKRTQKRQREERRNTKLCLFDEVFNKYLKGQTSFIRIACQENKYVYLECLLCIF